MASDRATIGGPCLASRTSASATLFQSETTEARTAIGKAPASAKTTLVRRTTLVISRVGIAIASLGRLVYQELREE